MSGRFLACVTLVVVTLSVAITNPLGPPTTLADTPIAPGLSVNVAICAEDSAHILTATPYPGQTITLVGRIYGHYWDKLVLCHGQFDDAYAHGVYVGNA